MVVQHNMSAMNKALGLSITPGVPIIGMVTRLTEPQMMLQDFQYLKR